MRVRARRFPGVTNTFTIELWTSPAASRPETAEVNNGVFGGGNQRFAVFPDHGGGYGEGHAGAGLSIGTNGISVFEHAHNYLPSRLVYSAPITGWTHVALVYSNRSPALYVNGVFAKGASVSAKSSVHPSASLGGGVGYGHYQGQLDEVRIWDVARSAAELRASMNCVLKGTETGLRGYWRLDEGTSPLTSDASGNGLTGRLISGPVWVTSARSVPSDRHDAGSAQARRGSSVLTWQAQNLITNGGFELGPSVRDSQGYQVLSPGSAQLPGWTVVCDDIVRSVNSNRWGIVSSQGSFHLDLAGASDSPPHGGITQVIPTTIGQTYRLSLDLGTHNRPDNPFLGGPIVVSVSTGFTNIGFTHNPTGLGSQWRTYSFVFVAETERTPIVIVGTAGRHHIGVDNVLIEPCGGGAVPRGRDSRTDRKGAELLLEREAQTEKTPPPSRAGANPDQIGPSPFRGGPGIPGRAGHADARKPANLLSNGGFEAESEPGKPAQWSTFDWRNGATDIGFELSRKAHSGKHSVAISSKEGGDGHWLQKVNVEPYRNYRFSGWVKTQDIVSKGGNGVFFDTGPGLGHVGIRFGREILRGSNDWRRFETVFNALHFTGLNMVTVFGGRNVVTGKAWFDDLSLVSMKEIPRIEGRIVNGSFEEADERWPLGWSVRTWSDWAPRFAYAKTGHTGSRSVRITAQPHRSGLWAFMAKVKRNTSYKLSGWIRTENLIGGARANLAVGVHDYFGTGNQPFATEGFEGTRNWTQVSLPFFTHEKEWIQIACQLTGAGDTAAGDAWFDDLDMEIVDAPAIIPAAHAPPAQLPSPGQPGVRTIPSRPIRRPNVSQTPRNEAMVSEELAVKRKELGDENPTVAALLTELADMVARQGKSAAAEPLYREALTIYWKAPENRMAPVQQNLYGLGSILEQQGKHEEVEGLFGEFLTTENQARPEFAGLLRWRGDFRARHGRWKDAAADLAKVVTLNTNEQASCFALAPLLIQTGDLAGYRAYRDALLARFGSTTNYSLAQNSALPSLLLPLDGNALVLASQLAQTAVTGWTNSPGGQITSRLLNRGTNSASAPTALPVGTNAFSVRLRNFFQRAVSSGLFTKGLAEYRQGRFASAAEWMKAAQAELEKSPVPHKDAQGCFGLAMAHQQLTELAKARAVLARGIEIVQIKLPALDSGNPGADWAELLTTHILMREAKQLIETGSKEPEQTR